MKLTKKVVLYPNKTMTKVLDDLCDYRRYCWNQGLNLWNELYNQRVKMVPADLRKKSQLAIKDKTICFQMMNINYCASSIAVSSNHSKFNG